MTRVILLIGFLGAGKTTLLTSLLESYSDHKIGVVVNEFGEVNVDAKLIKKDGIEMAELSNGSVFCACIKDKFVDSLIELSLRGLEYLFIEASGLADPANMGEILAGIAHKTLSEYVLEGAICVVDACTFVELSELLPALENQVAYANAVIINKIDLASEEDIRDTEQAILSMNPNVAIYKTSYCKVDVKEVVAGFTANEKTSGESTNTWDSRPGVVIVKATEKVSHAALEAFLQQIAPDSYRIKGFAMTEQGPVQISCVGKVINITPWDEPLDSTEIVVISAVGMKIMSSVIAASKSHTQDKFKV